MTKDEFLNNKGPKCKACNEQLDLCWCDLSDLLEYPTPYEERQGERAVVVQNNPIKKKRRIFA